MSGSTAHFVHKSLHSGQCQLVYSPPLVDRIWGIWGSYYDMPKAIFYLLKGDYSTTVAEGLMLVPRERSKAAARTTSL